MITEYELASMLVIRYQQVYQPFLSLLFVVIREVNSWIYSKFVNKMAKGDEWGAQHVGCFTIGIQHAVIMGYVVGWYATLETSILIMTLDFAINIYLSLKIVWLRKQTPQDIQKQTDLLQELARNELIEFVVPLAFLIALIFAYYGPNADLIGNICAEIWQYKAIEDINRIIKTMSIFFFIDFCSTVLSCIILWISCQINFLKVLMALVKEYQLVVCILLGSYLSLVSM